MSGVQFHMTGGAQIRQKVTGSAQVKQQVATFRGEPGAQGIPGAQGPAGYTPIKGVDYFDGAPGAAGEPGKDGGYYLPAVDSAGNLTWTASKDGMPAVASSNIQGPPGKDGEAGATGPAGANGKDGYTPIKGVDYFDGAPGATGATGPAGVSPTVSVSKSGRTTTITITDASGTKTATIKDGTDGSPGSDATVTAASVKNALGYTPMNSGEYAVSVKALGARGDNSTDDTAVFQSALANYRTVYVPGGKYKLSGELVVGSNCQLEFAQDAVLYFTQTTGNCISMKMSANIVGNHATVSVPYAFSGNVIYIYAGLNDSVKDIPPFTQWDPMWKTGRFITALNIVKPDPRGFYYSMDGTCNGTAVYLCARYDDASNFIWATNLSLLRIAGAFKYGVFAESFKDEPIHGAGWIHQLRVDGFIDGPEVGLYLKNNEHTYASVLILPRRAYTTDGEYIPYAKWGICLENTRDTNLLGSRVMDWNSTYSLWQPGNINQHIALLGNCTDVKLDDFLYYMNPSYDIRDLIYTDTPSNLESVSILEEPITRWFKPIDGMPYFNDGFTEKRLMLREELDSLAHLDRIPNFENKIPTAINTDGSIFYDKGYIQSGVRWNQNGGNLLTDQPNHGCTGLIPAKPGDVIRAQNLSYKAGNDYDNMAFFDENKNWIGTVVCSNLITNGSYYWSDNYAETDGGFEVQVSNRSGSVQSTAYVAFSFYRTDIGDQPIITVNEPLSYSEVGVLAETIYVKKENILDLPDSYSKAETNALIENAIGSAIGGAY